MAISLASISRTVRNALPPRIIVHGPQKIGKSTFGASAYKPIFLPLEDGLDGIETDAFPQLHTFAQVMEALEALKGDNDHCTVALDSLDWLEPLVWQSACDRNRWPNIEAPGFGKGYAEADVEWRALFALLNELRMKHGKAIVLIAHSRVKRFEAPDSEGFDRYELKLQARALGLAVEWADIIGFANEEVAIKKERNGMQERSRALGTGRRMLHLNAKPAYIAGNRYNLPDAIPLSWDALMAAMTPPAPVVEATPAAEAAAA